MEHKLSGEEMNAVKALADTNMKISEAQDTLFKLKASEEAYIEEREKKTLAGIQKLIDDSSALVDEARENYTKVQAFSGEVSNFVNSLFILSEQFTKLIDSFDKRNAEWEVNVARKDKEIADARKNIEIDKAKIETDRKRIKEQGAQILEQRIKLEDERGTIERMIIRFKEGRI